MSKWEVVQKLHPHKMPLPLVKLLYLKTEDDGNIPDHTICLFLVSATFHFVGKMLSLTKYCAFLKVHLK